MRKLNHKREAPCLRSHNYQSVEPGLILQLSNLLIHALNCYSFSTASWQWGLWPGEMVVKQEGRGQNTAFKHFIATGRDKNWLEPTKSKVVKNLTSSGL